MSAQPAEVFFDEPSQADLFSQNINLVKRIAYQLVAKLPPNIQVDDLIQAGMIGLLGVTRSYDPTQGATFETYAGIRIKGAMLDEVRRGDSAPRSLHRRLREAEAAMREIEAEQSRAARDSEVADRLGVSLGDYHQMLEDASAHKLGSFVEEGAESDLWRQSECGLLETIESEEDRDIVGHAVDSLPEREALIIKLYYHEDMTLREIGGVLGCSESRVCQLHAKALIRLKARLAE